MVDARQHGRARSRRCSRGKKSEGEQRLGRSRVGFSSKLHGLADGLGNALRFILTAGQSGAAPEAIPLLGTVSMLTVQAVLADRAHDSDAILAWITEPAAVPVIPPHPSRATTRETDWCLDKERAAIECLFGKMKHLRRVFSRVDKLAPRYLAFVHPAAACILSEPVREVCEAFYRPTIDRPCCAERRPMQRIGQAMLQSRSRSSADRR